MEAIQIGLAASGNIGHEVLRCDPRFFSRDHDRRAVSIIRTHKMHLIATQSHEPHPDVCLDVFHDVANVEWAVRVGQRRRHKQLAGRRTGGSRAHCVQSGEG